MANYYSFNTSGNNQNYGVSTPASFGNSSYGVAPSQQQNTFITPTHPVQQPQTAYVAYGHQSASSPASSQSYQGSYNNYPASTPQQPTYSKPVSQTQHYYPQGSSNNAAVGTTTFYSNSQNDIIKTEPPQTQIYAGAASAGYNQSLAQVKQVTIPSTSRVQPSSQLGYIASKPVTATVISSGPTSKSNSGYSQQSISNYEKALINAATSMYQQQRKGGGGVTNPMNNRNLPYWKQKRLQAQQNRDPNKPIVASEVKAYLYAWLGKERTRPEYNITAQGNSPFRQTYVCEVVAPGFQYVAKGAASNKKDAQTRAAWDFCDYLVKEGKMKEDELPTRENKFKAANNKLPASYKEKDQKQVTEVIAKKKLATKKINFVGGTALQLQASNPPSTVATTPIVYPTVTVDSTPKVVVKDQVIKTIAVIPTPTTIVKVKQENSAVPKALSANDVDVSASKNNPIGESYVEQVWTDGRVIRYRCKLCECEFNDPSARELHVRGRRHRMSYKKKVDPSIEVDVKLNPKQRNLMMMKMRQEARKDAMRQQQKERQMWKAEMKKQEETEIRLYEEEIWYQYQEDLRLYEEEMEYHRRRKIPPPTHLFPPQPPMLQYFQPHAQVRNQQMKTLDDQHVMMKHAAIYPTEEELTAVQKAVQHVEGALKEVSGAIHEQELKVYTASLTVNTKKPQPVRLLKAVLRIGALAKGLLLRGDLSVQLVLMCNEKPTVWMITRVADNLFKYLPEKGATELQFSMKISVEESAINLTTASSPSVNIKVILTSTSMRPSDDAKAAATKGSAKPDPPDILDRQKCSLALAALRHSKWFQAKANGLQSCVVITRIMKDLCVRVPTWSPLSDWAVELIVEKVISSAKLPMSPSAALQRVFEAVASGVLLPGGPGLLDPCEREPTDAAGSLTSQEREDITASAQHALRLMTFRNIHKVLGIESISASASKKRTMDEMADAKQESSEMAAKRGKVEV